MNKNNIKLIGIFATLSILLTLSTKPVFAGQYGEDECDDCNTRFRITKEVRTSGDTSWKDKVTDVKEGEIVEFRVTVKNKSDDETDDADNMETKDFLPDEMEKVGGNGLTEEFDDFNPGETRTFIITAKVKGSEYDRDVKFEKCVVNKVELRWEDDYEGSDTATVCYGNIEPSELPKTGAVDTLAIVGLGFLTIGFITKKKFSK
ncbi:MAG: hypothetical protein WAX66_01900 [Patescibacteria group bacterium]|jgi:hypothetical protein